jgi:hypothetical protein
LNFLYVDNSNVWIEGMHVSAVQNGLAPDIWSAQTSKIVDPSWNLDFGRLFDFAGGQASEVGRAVLFGSRPPPNDSMWAMASAKGFEVVVYDRNVQNKEKKVDTSIVDHLVTDSFERMNAASDEITLVAGDSDYAPTVERLRTRGFKVVVIFWNHASGELKGAATKFISRDGYLGYLRY